MILRNIASALEPADVSGIVIDEEERTAQTLFSQPAINWRVRLVPRSKRYV